MQFNQEMREEESSMLKKLSFHSDILSTGYCVLPGNNQEII
jgi:hypothetical protein